MYAVFGILLMATVALARPSSEVYYVVSPNDLLYRNFYYDSEMIPYMNAPLIIPAEDPKVPEVKAPEAEVKEEKMKLDKESELEVIPEGPILPPISEVQILLKDIPEVEESKIDTPAPIEEKPLEPSSETAEEPKPAEVLIPAELSTLAKPTADSPSILGLPLPIRPQTLLQPWSWNWSNLLPLSLSLPSFPSFPSLPSKAMLSRARVQVYGI